MIPVMLIIGWTVIVFITIWFIREEVIRHKRKKEDALYDWVDNIVNKVTGDLEMYLGFAILFAYILLSFLTYINWEKF